MILPRPQPLGNRIMYYVLCLHDVLRCGVSAQGTMGCTGEIAERLGDLVLFLAKYVCFLQIVVFRQIRPVSRSVFFDTVIFNLICVLFKHVIIIALIFNAV